MARGHTKALLGGAAFIPPSRAQAEDDSGAGVAKLYLTNTWFNAMTSERGSVFANAHYNKPQQAYSSVLRGGSNVAGALSIPGFSTGNNKWDHVTAGASGVAVVWGARSVAGAEATLRIDNASKGGTSLLNPLTFTQAISTTPVSGMMTATTTPSLNSFQSARTTSLNVTAVTSCVVTAGFAVPVTMITDVAAGLDMDPRHPLIAFNPGPVIGTYTGIPIPPASAATGQTDLVIRRFTAPFSCRAHSLQFNYAASAAGNSAKLVNATTGNVICASTSLVSTTPAATEIAAANLTNRNITRGDQLEIWVTTGGTAGFTYLGCNLIVHTTSWTHDNLDQDLLGNYGSGAALPTIFRTDIPRGSGVRTKYSGPMAGGIIGLSGPATGVSATQTNYVAAQIIAPCDGTILRINAVHGGSAAIGDGTTCALVNSTSGVTIFDHSSGAANALISQDLFGRNTAILAPFVRKGDVLQFKVTTGATGITGAYGRLMGSILLHATGHVNSHPRYD